MKGVTLEAMKTGVLVMLRHGESVWNAEEKFAGASDVPLSPLGKGQAMAAGMLLRDMKFDMVCTSTLERARHTWELMNTFVPTPPSLEAFEWLNERNFGLLEGLSRKEVQEKYGESQLMRWRFGWDEALPEASGETFKEMCLRVIPQFENLLLPGLRQGQHILIVGHGQVLRGIAMFIENAKIEDAPRFAMANAVPLAYKIDAQDIRRINMPIQPL